MHLEGPLQVQKAVWLAVKEFNSGYQNIDIYHSMGSLKTMATTLEFQSSRHFRAIKVSTIIAPYHQRVPGPD